MLYFLLLLSFVNLGLASAPVRARGRSPVRSHVRAVHRLQAVAENNDDACGAWVSTQTAFFDCINEGFLNTLPEKNIDTNNCTLTPADYDLFCTNSCYDIVMTGFETIASTGVCQSYFNQELAPCEQSGCSGGGVCYQGQCHPTCTTKADCDALNPCETSSSNCILVPELSEQVCTQNISTPILGGGNVNFKSAVYFFKSFCSKNTNNDYCPLLVENSTPWALTCNDVASWGCCTGTYLQMFTSCRHEKINNEALSTCPNAQDTCAPLPLAEEYCSFGSEVLPLPSHLLLVLALASVLGM